MVRPFGTVLGILYILLADGLISGASPLKWLVGLRCVDKVSKEPAGFRESVLRNLPFGLVALMLLIPVLGVVLAAILGVIFLGVEAYFLYSDPEGLRLGDVLADTTVIRTRPMLRPSRSHDELPPADEDADESPVPEPSEDEHEV